MSVRHGKPQTGDNPVAAKGRADDAGRSRGRPMSFAAGVDARRPRNSVAAHENVGEDSNNLVRSSMVGRGSAIVTGGSSQQAQRSVAEFANSARPLAVGRAFKLIRASGRVLLAVSAALDVWEIYEAEDRAAAATEKGGAWAGALSASAGAASAASPMLAAGPFGGVGLGNATFGAAFAAGFFSSAAPSTTTARAITASTLLQLDMPNSSG